MKKIRRNNHQQAKINYLQMNFVFVLFALLFFSPSCAHAQQSNTTIGTEHRIQSKILKEERRYIVNLPDSYENDDFYKKKKYPVLILLDASYNFHTASGTLRFMGRNEQIPEMIVVAVYNTDRTRDLTPRALNGGGDDFLEFLENELLPKIEKDYRTLPYRVLVGHSLGGLFAVDTFLQQRVFNAFVVIDPSLHWGEQGIVKKAKTSLDSKKIATSSLYLAQANNPFNEGKTSDTKGKAIQEFHNVLLNNSSEAFRYKYAFFEKEDHFTVPLISLYDGISYIFDGYRFPLNNLAEKNADDIKKHYEMLEKRFGVNIKPPGRLLNNVGLFLLNSERKVDKAIGLLKLNQEYYPQTFITFNSLADAYAVKGDKELAILNYKKSLELNPNNQHAKNAIKELT